MAKGTDYITLILAGGRGERLGMLTKETPKPAVNFCGSYRLIDFTLSNCVHSHAGVIGVITQYCQSDLADYIGTGSRWVSVWENAAITTLPPKMKSGIYDYYSGTADAIWKNADFIERYNPENILVLSGDHIYKMDYKKMMESHKKTGSAATIAALCVPWSEAPRFGIMEADQESKIVDFEEKPFQPKSNLASMGIYVFNWDTLKKHLVWDSVKSNSSRDVGKDIIPAMLKTGETLTAYRFDGYWKDVGSIYSLWEAHMEMLSASPGICLRDDGWDIISRDKTTVKYYDSLLIGNCRVVNSYLADDSKIKGTVRQSVISSGVEIMDAAKVVNSVIMPGAKIGRGAFVHKAIIGANAVVGDSMIIDGAKPDSACSDYCQGVALYAPPIIEPEAVHAGVQAG